MMHCKHKLKFIDRDPDMRMYRFICRHCWVSCKIHVFYFWGRK